MKDKYYMAKILWSNFISIWPYHLFETDPSSSLEYAVTQLDADYSAARIRKSSHLVFRKSKIVKMANWHNNWPECRNLNRRMGHRMLKFMNWLFLFEHCLVRSWICEKTYSLWSKTCSGFRMIGISHLTSWTVLDSNSKMSVRVKSNNNDPLMVENGC